MSTAHRDQDRAGLLRGIAIVVPAGTAIWAAIGSSIWWLVR